MAGTDMAAARTASLDKMVFLLAVLVEKSRGDDNIIHLSRADMNSLTTGKTLAQFLQIAYITHGAQWWPRR